MQWASFPLTLQAKQLLEEVTGSTEKPTAWRQDSLDLVIQCHQQMLVVAEADWQQAAAHAMAGWELLRILRACSDTLPEWIDVYEEQLCRCGGIAIHSLLYQKRLVDLNLCEAGQKMLRRLDEIHAGAYPWIQQSYRELSSLIPSSQASPSEGGSTLVDAASELRVIVVGNCQTHPLTIGLREALPELRIHACPSVHLATTEDVTRLHQWLVSAELLVMHRVQPGYRNDIGLDTQTLGRLLPSGARLIVLPNLHYEGHHPWIGYAHDPDGRLAALEQESPLGAYHDFLAMVAAHHGVELDSLLTQVCSAFLQQRLRALHEASLAELAKREAECDVSISDWIASNHRFVPIAHTINHPSQRSLDQILRRLLQQIGLSHGLGADVYDTREYLGQLTIPIHPWVRQSLQLESWSDAWGQVEGRPFSIADQLKASYAFYCQHPWIAECNRDHPKYFLATELLAEPIHQLLRSIQAESDASRGVERSEGSSILPSLFHCIWVSDAPLEALTHLGRLILSRSGDQWIDLPTLVEVACRTRVSDLIEQSSELLARHPPDEPLRSLLLLQLQLAAGSDPDVLRRIARTILMDQPASPVLAVEFTWRALASLLLEDESPVIQSHLQRLLLQVSPVEIAGLRDSYADPLTILQTRQGIAVEDAKRASQVYSLTSRSIRNPFAQWADPEAADPASISGLVARIRHAVLRQQGFSLIRLGDGEGLFLSGRRPDLGGATSNGAQIEPRLAAHSNCLVDPEHENLRRRFVTAISSADWIGIPDLPQCLNGPVDLVTVASGLALLLSPDQLINMVPRLAVGGCHVHNYLLQAGAYACAPFDRIHAVIAPSLPANLRDIPGLIWLQIPGEAVFRQDAFGIESHYPRVFEEILASIKQCIHPGHLVLVGAGILGKIYCEAIRQCGGIAIDVGSVIDLCSGHGGTRGEYRMNPWLTHDAADAFQPALEPG